MNEYVWFQAKPIRKKAAQWFKNGDHPEDYTQAHNGFEKGELTTFSPEVRRANGWEGDIVRYFRRPDVDGESVCSLCKYKMNDHGWIDTLEGGHIVCVGDWIITGVEGEHYPCKPSILEKSYDRVTDSQAVSG